MPDDQNLKGKEDEHTMEIPLFRIEWDEKDIEAVAEVIRSGAYWCTGAEIEEFEEAIADYLGVRHCMVFNSGGSALLALMHAHGFGPGDEIIVPSFTFIATPYAPLYVGARPIFADIEEDSFGLDPTAVERKITGKTKAVMPIHYGGMPCRINELKEITDERDLILIEDAAESFGAEIKGVKVGTLGESGMFSFCHNKVFTTSEGGCVVTNDEALVEKLALFRSYGRVMSGDYFSHSIGLDYVSVGHNLRMSTILASLGLSQLKRVDENIQKRRENARYLNQNLGRIEGIEVFTPPNDDYFCVYQMYTLRILEGEQKRNELMEYLRERGISNKVYFDPVHSYSVFRNQGYSDVDLPVTEELSSQVLTLPVYPDLTDEELKYMVNAIEEFM